MERIRVTDLVSLIGDSLFETRAQAARRLKYGFEKKKIEKMQVGLDIEKAIAITYISNKKIENYSYNLPLLYDLDSKWQISGRCDLWVPDSNLVAEFKFTFGEVKYLIPQYKTQLEIYALLLSKKFGLESVRGDLFFLSPSGFELYEYEFSDFDSVLSRINWALDYLERYDLEKDKGEGLNNEYKEVFQKIKTLRAEKKKIEDELKGLEDMAKALPPGSYDCDDFRVSIFESKSRRLDTSLLKDLPDSYYKEVIYKQIKFYE